MEYSIYPTLAEASINLQIVESNLRLAGIIGSNDIVNSTTTNPAYTQLYNYNIYKYLNKTAKEKFKDYSIVPDAVDYIIDVSPRFHKVQKFRQGFLKETILYVWDYVNNTPIEEISTITETYTTVGDSLYKSTESVTSRIKVRKWLSDEGYISGTEKITSKLYDTAILQREEGRRRRNNIITFLSKDYVLLRMFQLGEDQSTAEENAFLFYKNYSTRLAEFIEGSYEVINYLNSDTDSFLAMNMSDNIVTPDGLTMTQVYPSQVKELYNNDLTGYIGSPVKERFLDHLKGLV